jgi:hypothetical protein
MLEIGDSGRRGCAMQIRDDGEEVCNWNARAGFGLGKMLFCFCLMSTCVLSLKKRRDSEKGPPSESL